MTPSQEPDVRAAGVILVRSTGDRFRFLLLKNATHQSWGFPKGHLEAGEGPREGALRELEEETGLSGPALFSRFLARVLYRLPAGDREAGLLKEVIYFLAEAPAEWRPLLSAEHSQYAWCSFAEASERVDFEGLRAVVAQAQDYLLKGTPEKEE